MIGTFERWHMMTSGDLGRSVVVVAVCISFVFFGIQKKYKQNAFKGVMWFYLSLSDHLMSIYEHLRTAHDHPNNSSYHLRSSVQQNPSSHQQNSTRIQQLRPRIQRNSTQGNTFSYIIKGILNRTSKRMSISVIWHCETVCSCTSSGCWIQG